MAKLQRLFDLSLPIVCSSIISEVLTGCYFQKLTILNHICDHLFDDTQDQITMRMNLFVSLFSRQCRKYYLPATIQAAADAYCSKWVKDKQASYFAFYTRTLFEWYCACGLFEMVRSQYNIDRLKDRQEIAFKTSEPVCKPLLYAILNNHMDISEWLIEQLEAVEVRIPWAGI
jgi:hypothetical protein